MDPQDYPSGDPTLLGETVRSVKQIDKEEIRFETESGRKFVIMHSQDCCESVVIHDVSGDLQTLVGQKIVVYEGSWDNDLPSSMEPGMVESFTRSIFKVNDIVIECFGQSNGYYNESMALADVTFE